MPDSDEAVPAYDDAVKNYKYLGEVSSTVFEYGIDLWECNACQSIVRNTGKHDEYHGKFNELLDSMIDIFEGRLRK